MCDAPWGMDLPNREAWDILGRHLHHAGSSAPTHFTVMAAALLGGPTAVDAAQCTMVDAGDTTQWSAVVVTDTVVVDLAMTFHASNYTKDNDFDTYYQHNPVEITVDRAVTRALSAMTTITIEDVGRFRAASPADWIPILNAHITFADQTTLRLPSQDRLHRPEARAASNALWAALHTHLGHE